MTDRNDFGIDGLLSFFYSNIEKLLPENPPHILGPDDFIIVGVLSLSTKDYIRILYIVFTLYYLNI